MTVPSTGNGNSPDNLPVKDGSQAAELYGPKRDNPGTAGPGATRVQGNTPENKAGHLNPSAPGETSTTPGSAGEK